MGESHIGSPRTRSVLSLPGGGTQLRSGHWYAAAKRPCLRGETRPRWYAQFAPTLAWLNALALERQVARSLTTHTQASGNLCNLFQEHLPDSICICMYYKLHNFISVSLTDCPTVVAAAQQPLSSVVLLHLVRHAVSLSLPRLPPPATNRSHPGTV